MSVFNAWRYALGFDARQKYTAAFVEPMLLLRTEKLPNGPEWLIELKLDGYRTLAIKSAGKVETPLAQ